MDRPAKKIKFDDEAENGDDYKCPAAQAVRWHLVESVDTSRLEKELSAGGMPFSCEFYHQVFGEEEEISGYKDLVVDIYLSAKTYHALVEIKHTGKRSKADDMVGLLKESFPSGFSTSTEDFIAKVAGPSSPNFLSIGRSVSEGLEGPGYKIHLRHCKLVDTPEWYQEIHARLEPLMLFTIDGANFIEKDDPKWEVVLAVIEKPTGQMLAGVMCLYNFYAWPLSQRPRVAQILVLPPFQGAGIGKEMLRAAYELAKERDAVDLTFEDPSPDLQRIREKLEVEMLLDSPCVVEASTAAIAAAGAAPSTSGPEHIGTENGAAGASTSGSHGGQQHKEKNPLDLPAELKARIMKELKVHPPQVCLAWEVLLWMQPELHQRAQAQAAFKALVMGRIEHSTAQSVDAYAKLKVGPVEHNEGWFLYKRGKSRGASEGAGEDAAADNTVSIGRHTITQVSADELAEKLTELYEERLQQIKELASRLRPSEDEEAGDGLDS